MFGGGCARVRRSSKRPSLPPTPPTTRPCALTVHRFILLLEAEMPPPAEPLLLLVAVVRSTSAEP